MDTGVQGALPTHIARIVFRRVEVAAKLTR